MGMVILVILALIGVFVILPLIGSLLNTIIVLLIWAAIGWLAGKFLRGRGFGTIGNILLGLGGGLLGGILFGILAPGLTGGLLGTLISGVVGAVVLVYLIRLLGISPQFGR